MATIRPRDWNQLHREAIDNWNIKITESGSTTFIAKSPLGTNESDPLWQVKKVDETSGLVVTWADGDDNFDNVATDLTALTYS